MNPDIDDRPPPSDDMIPFGDIPVEDRQMVKHEPKQELVHGAAAVAISTAARVEAEGKMILARRFPRDLARVESALVGDCERPSFARMARYARPVGGDCDDCEGTKSINGKPCRECDLDDGKGPTGKKVARGLSIHFARSALARMGNLDVRIMLLHEDEGESVMRCSATELESNSHYSVDVKVSKIVERRKLRKGQKALGTRQNSWGDNVYLVRADEGAHEKDRAAAAAKKLRDCILTLVPQDIKEACELQVIATNEKAIDKDRAKTTKQMLAAFGALNPAVTEVELAAYLGHPVADVTGQEYNALQAIYMGLREGQCSWTDIMADRRGDTERGEGEVSLVDGLQATVKQRLASARAKKDAAPANGSAPSAPQAAQEQRKEAAPANPTPASAEQQGGAEERADTSPRCSTCRWKLPRHEPGCPASEAAE